MTRREGSAKLSADGIAEALRSSPPELDDVRRARMERRVLEGTRGGAGRSAARGSGANGQRARWATGGALVALAAALAIGWIVWPSEGVSTARFVIASTAGGEAEGSSGATGTVDVGGSLEVGEGERAEVQVGNVDIDLGSGTAMRFASLDARDVRLELASGEVEVAFHPRERGRERLSIETPSARVEVVGTVFRVRIEGGSTRVSVTEGTVRVVPRGAQASAVLVRAGESVAVSSASVASGEAPSTSVASGEAPSAAAVAVEAHDVVARGVAPEGTAEASVTEPVATAEPSGASVEAPEEVEAMTPRQRLALAEGLVQAGHDVAARRELAGIVGDRSAPTVTRIEAYSLMGDSLQRTGDPAGAVDAFERAAQLGRGRPEGHLAIFALARVQERSDRDAARATYLRYLEEAPNGANADGVRQAVCRLGGDPSVECGGPRR